MKIDKNWIYATLNKYQAEKMGAVWNQKEDRYRLPKTVGAMNELKNLGYPLIKQIQEQNTNRKKLLDIKRVDDAPGDKRLRPYQRVDVNYLKRIGSAGIFNEQRTGKTPTSLVLCDEKGYETVLIVAPATLLINWGEEVETWLSGSSVFLMSGTKKQREQIRNQFVTSKRSMLTGKSFMIVSYETLRNDLDQLKKIGEFDCMIVDEAHRLRSLIKGRNASKVSRAVTEMGKRAKVRYALTGTPVVKQGEEIWGILHFLYPDKFPGYWQFLDRYFESKFNGFGNEVVGYKRKNEIQEILAIASTNRKRQEVMQWLPAKQYQTIKLEMNTKQAKVYKDVKETFIHEDLIDASGVLAQLTRLRQISSVPDTLVPDLQSEKEKFIMEWIEDNPDESVVVFSTFSTYLNNLAPKIKGSMLITGQQTKEQRDQAVKSFQSGKTKVLLANITAAGTGLTLDKGETVIFLDKQYNPSENEQAEDRIVPVSVERNHNMHVISLVMNGTVDVMIQDLLERKTDITKVINSGGLDALERLWKSNVH